MSTKTTKQYIKRSMNASYAFWLSTVVRTKKLEKERPGARIKFGKASTGEETLATLKSPTGEEVVIVAPPVRTGMPLPQSSTGATSTKPIQYPFPYEQAAVPDDKLFEYQKKRFDKEFVAHPSKGLDYGISDDNREAIIDLNNPTVISNPNNSGLISSLLHTVEKPPVLETDWDLFSEQLRAQVTKIANSPKYATEVLKKLIDVLGPGRLHLYLMEDMKPDEPLAISDGRGHFVLMTAEKSS